MRAFQIACVLAALSGAVFTGRARAADAPDPPLYLNVARDAAAILHRLDELARAGQWDKASGLAQQHIEDKAGRLFEIEPRRYIPFAERVRREVVAWPDAGRKAYGARTDEPARELLEAALKARDLARLANVAARYPASSSAPAALSALAGLHLERGELDAAERALKRAIALRPGEPLTKKLKVVRAAIAKRDAAPAEPPALAGVGPRRWSFTLDRPDVDGPMAEGLRARGLAVPKILRPAVSGGKVFVQTTRWIGAVDLKTGALAWRHPEQPPRSSGRDCADAVLAPVALSGRVYATVSGQLVALTADSGRVAWRYAHPAEGDAAPRPERIVSSPAVGGGSVFACITTVAQETRAVVVALDARSGEVRWRRALCSLGFRGVLGRGVHPAPPTYHEGVVYVSTNLGAVAALDAHTGEVLWLARYESFDLAARQKAFLKDKVSRNAAPLVRRGAVIVAPQDSPKRIALDARTGKTVAKRPLPPEASDLVVAGDVVLSASFDRVDAHANAKPPAEEPRKPPPPRPEEPDETKKLMPVWRTAFDPEHARPTIIASDDRSVFLTTAAWSAAGRPTPKTIERRRLIDGRLLWRMRFPHALKAAHVAKDVLVLRGARQLVGLDAATRRALWRAPRAAAPLTIVDSAVAGGRAFAVGEEGGILAVDALRGRELWRRKLGGPLAPAPPLEDGKHLVFFRRIPAALFRLDPATGKTALERDIGDDDTILTRPPAFQKGSGRACVVLDGREVRNIALADGKTLWKIEMPFGVGRVASTPDEKRIVVFPDRMAFGDEVVCLDATTGRKLWRRKPWAADPATVYVDNELIVGTRWYAAGNGVVAWRAESGEIAWRRLIAGEPALSRVVAAGEFVVAVGGRASPSGGRSRAVVLQKKSGKVVAAFDRPGTADLTCLDAGGTLLLCFARSIEAYRMTSEAEVARRANLLEKKPGALSERAVLLAALGEHDAAMTLLEMTLGVGLAKPGEFDALHDRLRAIREAAHEKRPARYEVPFFAVPPEIDGGLHEDWRRDRAVTLSRLRHVESMHPGGGLHWTGPGDLSATLYLAWDNANLYIAVDVRDNEQTMHDFDAAEFKGDCLVVAFDPEGNGGHRRRGHDVAYLFGLAAKGVQPRGHAPRGGGQRIRRKKDGTGVVYELAVPWKELRVAPRFGRRLGLNISVIDDDGAGATKALSWTSGLTPHRNRHIMSGAMTPALFGTLDLKER